MFDIYMAFFMPMLFINDVHIMQYGNVVVKFWRKLNLHIGYRYVHSISNVHLFQHNVKHHTTGVIKINIHCKPLDNLPYSPNLSSS